MQIPAHYVAYTDFNGDGQYGHGCEPSSFDDACDAYADQMDDGCHTVVFRVEPANGDRAGAMIDVTDDAITCVTKRCYLRNIELPEWLIEANEALITPRAVAAE